MALSGIAGQEKALKILFGMLKRDRIPSAMLFSGDTGIGKRLAAVNYAKAINCLQPAGFAGIDCCDACASCKKIDAAAHPDVTFAFPEKDEIKIDAIRKLEETLFMKPLEGRKKIAIIDDADSMNSNAANAFLKTLEEPPSDSLIILVSPNPDGLPDTIRSRCITLRFYPLSQQAFRKVISGTPTEEQGSPESRRLSVAEGDIDVLSRISMGRPGLALSGDAMRDLEWFNGLFMSMVNGESKEAWTDKEAIRTWLDMAAIFLRDAVVAALTGNEADLLYGKALRNVRRKTDITVLLDTYQALQKLRGLLDFNLNKSITWNYVAHMMRQTIDK